MTNMFKWFNKHKTENKDDNNVENKCFNYKTTDDGDILMSLRDYSYWNRYFKIPKESIISHTKDLIKFTYQAYTYNHNIDSKHVHYNPGAAIERKENLIQYREMQKKVCYYDHYERIWRVIRVDIESREIVFEKTPLEIFKEQFKSGYKLIETEDEFNAYMSSVLDCDTWCRKKLYDKMQELGLGDGFINQFADLIGNNLEKYHAMIDLANEVTDKDTLMYLYIYKFGEK